MEKIYYDKVNKFIESHDLESCITILETLEKRDEKEVDYHVLANVYMMKRDFNKAKNALKKDYKRGTDNRNATLARGYIDNDENHLLNQLIYRKVFVEPTIKAEKFLVNLKEKSPSIYKKVLRETCLTQEELIPHFVDHRYLTIFDYILCKVFNNEKIKSPIKFKKIYGADMDNIIESLFEIKLGPYDSEKNDELLYNKYLNYRENFGNCEAHVYALCVAAVIKELI